MKQDLEDKLDLHKKNMDQSSRVNQTVGKSFINQSQSNQELNNTLKIINGWSNILLCRDRSGQGVGIVNRRFKVIHNSQKLIGQNSFQSQKQFKQNLNLYLQIHNQTIKSKGLNEIKESELLESYSNGLQKMSNQQSYYSKGDFMSNDFMSNELKSNGLKHSSDSEVYEVGQESSYQYGINYNQINEQLYKRLNPNIGGNQQSGMISSRYLRDYRRNLRKKADLIIENSDRSDEEQYNHKDSKKKKINFNKYDSSKQIETEESMLGQSGIKKKQMSRQFIEDMSQEQILKDIGDVDERELQDRKGQDQDRVRDRKSVKQLIKVRKSRIVKFTNENGEEEEREESYYTEQEVEVEVEVEVTSYADGDIQEVISGSGSKIKSKSRNRNRDKGRDKDDDDDYGVDGYEYQMKMQKKKSRFGNQQEIDDWSDDEVDEVDQVQDQSRERDIEEQSDRMDGSTRRRGIMNSNRDKKDRDRDRDNVDSRDQDDQDFQEYDDGTNSGINIKRAKKRRRNRNDMDNHNNSDGYSDYESYQNMEQDSQCIDRSRSIKNQFQESRNDNVKKQNDDEYYVDNNEKEVQRYGMQVKRIEMGEHKRNQRSNNQSGSYSGTVINQSKKKTKKTKKDQKKDGEEEVQDYEDYAKEEDEDKLMVRITDREQTDKTDKKKFATERSGKIKKSTKKRGVNESKSSKKQLKGSTKVTQQDDEQDYVEEIEQYDKKKDGSFYNYLRRMIDQLIDKKDYKTNIDINQAVQHYNSRKREINKKKQEVLYSQKNLHLDDDVQMALKMWEKSIDLMRNKELRENMKIQLVVVRYRPLINKDCFSLVQ